MGSKAKRHFTRRASVLTFGALAGGALLAACGEIEVRYVQGPAGPAGASGAQGERGATGSTGTKGAAGAAGQTQTIVQEKVVTVEKPVVVEKVVTVDRPVVVEKVVEVPASQTRTQHAPAKAPGPAPAAGQAQGTIRFMFRAGPEEKGFEAITKVFRERNPNVEVITEPTAGGHESKMLIQTAAGTEPDLMWTASIGNLYDFVAYDAWLPLDAYAKRDKISLDQWYPAAVETMREDGILWALPLWSHPSITGLYYNKDKFDQAGLDYPNENWTQDQLLEAAQQLTKRGESGEAKDQQWGYRPLTGYYNGFLQDIWAGGGGALNKERTASQFNEGVVRDAIQRVYDWFHRYRTVPPPAWSWGGSPPDKLPQSTLAMWANGYWGWWGSQAWEFNWGVTQLPKGRGGTNGGMLQTDAIPITKRSEFPDAAWELHKLHSSKEGGLMLNDHRLIPSSRPDVWTDPALTATEAHRSWHNTLLSAHPLEYPSNLWVSQFHSQLTEAAFPTWKGELSVDQGVQQLTRIAVNILNRPRPRL